MSIEQEIQNTIDQVESMMLAESKKHKYKHKYRPRVKLDAFPDKTNPVIPDYVLQSIYKEMESLDPEQATRLYFVRTHYRNKQREYNLKRKLKKQAKSYYQPVVQSPSEHDDIDYDLL